MGKNFHDDNDRRSGRRTERGTYGGAGGTNQTFQGGNGGGREERAPLVWGPCETLQDGDVQIEITQADTPRGTLYSMRPGRMNRDGKPVSFFRPQDLPALHKLTAEAIQKYSSNY